MLRVGCAPHSVENCAFSVNTVKTETGFVA
jgi:hypothetical protein